MGRLLTAREAADRCGGVGVSTIYYWATQNMIPHVRLGEKVVRFPEDELERWLHDQVRKPVAAAN